MSDKSAATVKLSTATAKLGDDLVVRHAKVAGQDTSLRVDTLAFLSKVRTEAEAAGLKGAAVAEAVGAERDKRLSALAVRIRREAKLADSVADSNLPGYRTRRSVWDRAKKVAVEGSAETVAAVLSGAMALDVAYASLTSGKSKTGDGRKTLAAASVQDVAAKVVGMGADAFGVFLRAACAGLGWDVALPVLIDVEAEGAAAIEAATAPVAEAVAAS